MYQIVSDDSEVAALQQRMAFMGCSMKCLRNSLATWVHFNTDCGDSRWIPSLQAGTDQLETFYFPASESFAQCMRGTDSDKLMGERCGQMRFLSEFFFFFFFCTLQLVFKEAEIEQSTFLCHFVVKVTFPGKVGVTVFHSAWQK